MSTNIETTKAFNERIFERIRQQIGELMTDEDLKKLVDAAIQKAFFEDRIVISDDWRREKTTKPPYLVEQIKELMQPAVQQAAQAWLDAHADEVRTQIDDALGRGFTGIVSNYLDRRFGGPILELQNKLMSLK